MIQNPTKKIGLVYKKLSSLIEVLRKATIVDDSFNEQLNNAFIFRSLLVETIENLSAYEEADLREIATESEDEFRTLLYNIRKLVKKEI